MFDGLTMNALLFGHPLDCSSIKLYLDLLIFMLALRCLGMTLVRCIVLSEIGRMNNFQVRWMLVVNRELRLLGCRYSCQLDKLFWYNRIYRRVGRVKIDTLQLENYPTFIKFITNWPYRIILFIMQQTLKLNYYFYQFIHKIILPLFFPIIDIKKKNQI
jgi:hypothetical protein